jgi:hypothetical protein
MKRRKRQDGPETYTVQLVRLQASTFYNGRAKATLAELGPKWREKFGACLLMRLLVLDATY